MINVSMESDIYKVIFETAAEGVVVVSKEGQIIFINSRMESLFGYTKAELVGNPIEILIPDAYRSGHSAHRDGYMSKPVRRSMGAGMDLLGQRKDGTQFPVEIGLNSVKMDDTTYVIALISNITRRKEMEHALEDANNTLEEKVESRTRELEEALVKVKQAELEAKRLLAREKELNELKSRFVAMASHEFRTPLSGVMTSTALIEKYIDLGLEKSKEKIEKHTKTIKGSVHNLTGILNDFLSLEKLETNKVRVTLEKINLKSFLDEIVSDLSSVLKNEQYIISDYKYLDDFVTDKTIFKTIMNNLLSNAIKYSSDFQTVELKAEIEEDGLLISVRDYGLGIPLKDQKHMFDRFFRAGNVTNISGTGLGLNIVKKQVELLKGKIRFESKEGEGTCFYINLPKLNLK